MIGHLIHVGYAKAGSTFLKRWFAQHPQIAYVDGGLAGFYDLYDLARYHSEPRADSILRVSSSEGLVTPHPFVGMSGIEYPRMARGQMPDFQSAACATLANLFPNAHILLVTRGFRSVMLSGYSQYVRTGGPGEFFALHPDFGVGKRGGNAWDYGHAIGLYRAAFGDRLIVMPYELLRDDPGRFTRLIEDRFGLAHCPPSPVRLNAALSGTELRWYPRLTRMVLRLPVGEAARRRLLNLYVRLANRNRLRPLIRLLQKIKPLEPVTADLIGDEVLARFRHKAECLRGDPLYAPYARDYLHS